MLVLQICTSIKLQVVKNSTRNALKRKMFFIFCYFFTLTLAIRVFHHDFTAVNPPTVCLGCDEPEYLGANGDTAKVISEDDEKVLFVNNSALQTYSSVSYPNFQFPETGVEFSACVWVKVMEIENLKSVGAVFSHTQPYTDSTSSSNLATFFSLGFVPVQYSIYPYASRLVSVFFFLL